MTGKSSPSKATPLLLKGPDDHKREMAIVTAPSSPFRLPDDWVVEERPRTSHSCAGRIDRYYYEPGTGRQFRSLRSVERYLMDGGEHTPTPKALKSDNQIVMFTPRRSSGFKLPNDWVVEEKPRTSGQFAGQVDKYYYEPGTGRQFRSLLSVERYLNESKDNKTTLRALISGNQVKPSQNSDSQKKNISSDMAKTLSFDFANPPLKINWVLTGPGDTWTPFMGESMVPESVKQQWAKAFVLSIN